MKSKRTTQLITLGLILMAVCALTWPILSNITSGQAATISNSDPTTACTTLGKPSEIPQPYLINFDDLTDGTIIDDKYKPSFGVSFEESPSNRAIISGDDPSIAFSPPNVAINEPVPPNTSINLPMLIDFREPKTHVGFYFGNAMNRNLSATVNAYNAFGQIVCRAFFTQVPQNVSLFVGFYDSAGSIVRVTLDYGDSDASETIDNLYFSPRYGLPPARTPLPTWTPIPSPSPTPGPSPTATPIIPMVPYNPVVEIHYRPFIIMPDVSIHGIEITQGIQCFDSSKGLMSCPDNSLPVVTKKDTTAQIYLKTSASYPVLSNVRVRLYIIANGVTYTSDTLGKATQSIDQSQPDNADIYFIVNFNSSVPVEFYAYVDPNNTLAESNESNNRFPASGTITLNFVSRTSLKVVGYRADYHPDGYSGTRYAGGWAVNGGAADWYEQVLPIRNNGINYSVRSSYLNWTSSLTPCSSSTGANNQHSMIQTLNTMWVIENLFSFWFSGAFTGADHVYGWVPNAGYPCGHADMPVYPHAGGLGVVGIGGDAAGTNTDNPESGALIFGHELTHDYNLFHTNTADACGSNDGNSNFPYSNSSIQEFGFNPITGKIYNPVNTHDLMSYCPSGGSKQGWISPITWIQMYNDLSQSIALSTIPTGTSPVGLLLPAAASSSLEVNATIFNPIFQPPSSGKLGNLHKVDTGAMLVLPQGPYAVELRDAAGNILASQSFAVDFESEYDAHLGNTPEDAPPFPADPNLKMDVSFIMPWVDGTTSVVLTENGGAVDQKTVSPNPPQVLITSPVGQENWLPGTTHTINWQGLDLDGDPLVYALFYSYDGGLNWGLLAEGLSSTSYDIQTNNMAGGSDVRFRIVATDGVLTGVDETDNAISIPNQAPQATIMNPVDGADFLPGSLVILQGIGIDMEDGTLPDGALVWSSNIQGGLGVGPSVALNTLVPGKHQITLTVADSYGLTTSTQVKITIAYDTFLPRATRK